MSAMVTKEKNAQVIISLLKQNNIRHIIASPGNTNIALVGSVQNDPFFKVYSSVDERSAAYLACGLAEELGEPVVITCTGATASRNYAPGLTEAYYRKLPILAVTSTQNTARVGHLIAQVIDRSSVSNDVAKYSVTLPIVKDSEDLWDCEIKVNKAIHELTRNGGGPVHLNLETSYQLPFTSEDLPKYRNITRFEEGMSFPSLPHKVAIFIGSHRTFTKDEISTIELFCAQNNAVVFCDHTSGYYGKYKLNFALVASQDEMKIEAFKPDLTIHIGEVTGDYPSLRLVGRNVWRVSEDGEIRDTFKRLTKIFETNLISFLNNYISEDAKVKSEYYDFCHNELKTLRSSIPELPFSNIWIASEISGKLPENSVVHLGILNTLRSWNFFDLPETVRANSNVGGFGIDGVLSSLIGASMAKPGNIFFCILGDLALFYDLNVLGNRHVNNNVRVMVINNGKGTEFRNYNHHAAYFNDEDADKFISSAGHYGNKSRTLLKSFSESLGYEYLSASNKDEFYNSYDAFLDPKINEKPMIFEIFTDSSEESKALNIIHTMKYDGTQVIKNKAKKMLGKSSVSILKNVLKK